MATPPFEVICEIEPATRPDLTRVRHQIGVMSSIASGFLVPDNHIGRATVSSIAVAHEVELMGGRAIACVNARDRNLLGFRRDLLTAAAYGVADFLFVYGDDPTTGRRTGQLTVRSMLEEVRTFSTTPSMADRPMRAGVASRLGQLPEWKADADFVFSQVTYDLDGLYRWRDALDVGCPVYAGVMVIPSASMARKLTSEVPQLAPPADVVAAVESDRGAGVEIACQQVLDIRAHGGFAGVHLVPVARYREVAARLETELGRL